MRASSVTMAAIAAAVAIAAACGGRQPAEEPAPEPAPAPAPAPASEPAPVATDTTADSERMAREAAERARAVTADLATMIHFDYDQSVIRPDDQAVLDRKAQILQANPNATIRVSGHADERGSDEYNLALGNRRAAAAKRYLQNKGVDGSRIEAVSYGEERPLSQGTDEAAYAENRRDEFELASGGESLVAPQ